MSRGEPTARTEPISNCARVRGQSRERGFHVKEIDDVILAGKSLHIGVNSKIFNDF